MGYAKTRTFIQYRNVDLLIWAVILCVFESIVCKAGSTWFVSQPYVVSIIPAVVSIVYVRWGFYGVVHSFLGGFVYALLSKGNVTQIITYSVGNMLSLVSVVLLIYVGKSIIAQNTFLSALFAMLTAFLMQLGRAFVAFVLNHFSKFDFNFITTDILSGVFAALIVLIVRKADGIFEDQKTYLFRINRKDDGGSICND